MAVSNGNHANGVAKNGDTSSGHKWNGKPLSLKIIGTCQGGFFNTGKTYGVVVIVAVFTNVASYADQGPPWTVWTLSISIGHKSIPKLL